MNSMVKELRLWALKILFKLEYAKAIKVLKGSSDNIMAYPLMVYMSFNKDKMLHKYLQGENVVQQLEEEAKRIKRRILNKMNRIAFNPASFELVKRYRRFVTYCENKKEIEAFCRDNRIVL